MLMQTATTSSGWISVHRDVRRHPVVGFGQPVPPADPKRGSYSRNEAWTDLLMEAAYAAIEVMNKGRVVMLQRGQLMAAIGYFATRWNWTEKTVRGFFDRLQTHGMAVSNSGTSDGKSKGRFARVLSICNYDIYQTAKELEGMLTVAQAGMSGAGCGQVEGKNLIREQVNKLTKEDPSLRSGGAQAQLDLAVAEPPPPPTELTEPTEPAKKKGRQVTEARRLSPDWTLPDDWCAETVRLHNPAPADIERVAARFKRYWLSGDAKNPAKKDWKATWLNWFDREVETGRVKAGVGGGSGRDGYRYAPKILGSSFHDAPMFVKLDTENRERARRGEPELEPETEDA